MCFQLNLFLPQQSVYLLVSSIPRKLFTIHKSDVFKDLRSLLCNNIIMVTSLIFFIACVGSLAVVHGACPLICYPNYQLDFEFLDYTSKRPITERGFASSKKIRQNPFNVFSPAFRVTKDYDRSRPYRCRL
jgi:hypothetical protein